VGFGKNLQYLRKMRNGMTQEALAEILQVSRQTVSKWELDAAYPEINKAIEICRIFSCSMDNLFREDMDACNEAYCDIRVETVKGFRYVSYEVISGEPEEDAINHVTNWAKSFGVEQPQIIGWDFPFLSQEQINVYNMHGYAAAWILPSEIEMQKVEIEKENGQKVEIKQQNDWKYAAITIKGFSEAPFDIIPNAYKTLMTYMDMNGLEHVWDKNIISCYERSYIVDDKEYMDVYIATS